MDDYGTDDYGIRLKHTRNENVDDYGTDDYGIRLKHTRNENVDDYGTDDYGIRLKHTRNENVDDCGIKLKRMRNENVDDHGIKLKGMLNESGDDDYGRKLKRMRDVENVDDYGWKLKGMRNKNVVEVEEILTNILSRLPVKSLLICKTVCKYWRGLIGSSSFILLHLTRSQQKPALVIYPGPTLSTLCRHLYSSVEGEIPGEYTFFGDMIGCFNGLICFYYSHSGYKEWYKQILICNPATRELLFLPETHSGLKSAARPPTGGVCFGPPLHGYKVFNFFCIKENHLYECQIYSSSTASWKSIGTVERAPSSSRNHVCINGVAYWLSTSMIDGRLVDHILAVDWDEKFTIIRLPKENPAAGRRCFLINLHGCLTLVIVSTDRFEMWTSQKTCEQYVWAEKLSRADAPKELFMDDGPCILFPRERSFRIVYVSKRFCITYSLKTSSWRRELIRKLERFSFTPLQCPCNQSLLPCNGCLDVDLVKKEMCHLRRRGL